MSVFENAYGRFDLQRYPARPADPLQAWNTADAYVLDHLHSVDSDGEGSLLLIREEWGVLATVLAGRNPVSWNDSWLARQALLQNLKTNPAESGSGAPAWIPASETPSGVYSTVVLKLPKSLAFFEDLLLRLRPLMDANTRLICAGMIKHTPAQAYRLLEKIIGPTRTSQGRKKARLAFSTLDPDLVPPAALPDAVYRVEGFDLELTNGPNLFSRDRLDRGTGLLLENLEADPGHLCGDLGCGNGVLALALARRSPEAQVIGIDTSYQAVACARGNAVGNGFHGERVRFLVGDGFEDTEDPDLDVTGKLDFVACNPPFHQGQTVGDSVAWNLFHQARRALRAGGEFLIVGNRHLSYHVKLNRIFGNCRTVASDRKFVVLSAIKG